MLKPLGLSAMTRPTQSAPLAALGYVLPQRDCFAPLREHVQLGGKTVLHEPHAKRLEVVVSMLADCASLKPINTRLRPATALAAAWGRKRLADQATITRVLDAFTPGSVAQLPVFSANRGPVHVREKGRQTPPGALSPAGEGESKWTLTIQPFRRCMIPGTVHTSWSSRTTPFPRNRQRMAGTRLSHRLLHSSR